MRRRCGAGWVVIWCWQDRESYHSGVCVARAEGKLSGGVSHALLHIRAGTPKGSVTEKLYTQSLCSIYVVVSWWLTGGSIEGQQLEKFVKYNGCRFLL